MFHHSSKESKVNQIFVQILIDGFLIHTNLVSQTGFVIRKHILTVFFLYLENAFILCLGSLNQQVVFTDQSMKHGFSVITGSNEIPIRQSVFTQIL